MHRKRHLLMPLSPKSALGILSDNKKRFLSFTWTHSAGLESKKKTKTKKTKKSYSLSEQSIETLHQHPKRNRHSIQCVLKSTHKSINTLHHWTPLRCCHSSSHTPHRGLPLSTDISFPFAVTMVTPNVRLGPVFASSTFLLQRSPFFSKPKTTLLQYLSPPIST